MSVPSLWAGLGESAFVAGSGERERSPLRVAATVVAGLGVAVIAAICVWCLTMVPYTLLTGRGGSGLKALGEAAYTLVHPAAWTLQANIAFLAITTAVDAAPFVTFVAFAAAVAHRPVLAYATAAPRFRWRLMGLGLAMSCLVLTPMVVAERTMGGAGAVPLLAASATLGGRLLYAAAALMLIPAALAEELIFRGWLLRQTAAFVGRTGALLLVSSILFAAAHFALSPLDIDPDAFLELALMGAGFAYMTLRLGGIEFAGGAHAANNILVVLFIQPLRPELPKGSPGAISIFTDLALLVGYFIITEAVVRWPLLRRLGSVEDDELSPPDGPRPDPAEPFA